uniref:MADF domain-containing protein n=1 Tax=Cacopsylla melanoneura TaxID=428564 RepID=A0A8D8LU61_9HEMI
MQSPQSKEVERKFLREFLALYKSLPELWNTSSEAYKDRWRKTQGYETLVTKYKELYPNATREDVTKRLNCLRTNYRKERRRIRSIREQLGDEYEIMSNVWYYQDLMFLDDLEPGAVKSEMRKFAELIMDKGPSNNTSQCGEEMDMGLESADMEMEDHDDEYSNDDYERSIDPDITIEEKEPETTPETTPTKRSKRKRRHSSDSDDSSSAGSIDSKYTPEMADQDLTSILWGNEMGRMYPAQVLYAKKAINVILYEGQLGNLYYNCFATDYRGRGEPAQRQIDEGRIDFEIFERQATKWTTELALMSKEQQIHAKKFMNEILYEGAFGNLKYSSLQFVPRPAEVPDGPASSEQAPTEQASRILAPAQPASIERAPTEPASSIQNPTLPASSEQGPVD